MTIYKGKSTAVSHQPGGKLGRERCYFAKKTLFRDKMSLLIVFCTVTGLGKSRHNKKNKGKESQDTPKSSHFTSSPLFTPSNRNENRLIVTVGSLN